MRKRIPVSPLNNETLSQCQYRAVGLAFEDFKEFNIYYFDGYGGWMFEFYYDLPENIQVIDKLTFHFDLSYQYTGHERQNVFMKSYTIVSENDADIDFKNMQAVADKVCEDIDDFWENKESYFPGYPDNL